MLLAINVRFQIAALLVMIFILSDYWRNKHLHLRSSIYFKALMAAVFGFIVFDMLCIYGVNNFDKVSVGVIRILYNIKFMMLAATVTAQFMYVKMLVTNQARLSVAEKALVIVPLFLKETGDSL